MGDGAQCVMMAGTTLMQLLSAINLDFEVDSI